MGEKMLAEFAPLIPSLIDKYFANKDRDYELNMIVAKNAAERIRLQKEQGIGNGEWYEIHMNYRQAQYLMLSTEEKKELAKSIVELLPDELVIDLLDAVIYTME